MDECKETLISQVGWVPFPDDPYVALKEVQKMLGLTDLELDVLLALLRRAERGHLSFNIGSINIEFSTGSFEEKEIQLEIEVTKKNISSSARYELKADSEVPHENDTV